MKTSNIRTTQPPNHPTTYIQNSKAQIWSLDIMVGLALFLVGIVIFYTYSVNQPSQARDSLETLKHEGELLAESLLSEGYPEYWDTSSVKKIGLTNSKKINQTKLEALYQMSKTDYTKTQNIFATSGEYYIFFEENMTTTDGPIEGFGKPGSNLGNIEGKNLIKITRFTIYQNKTTPIYIYIWEE